MASVPPVPPRPHESQASSDPSKPPPPPPLPPLPPELRAQNERYNTPSVYEADIGAGGYRHMQGESQPHFDNPLIAPRPHRIDPNVGANMARTLDDQADSRFEQGPPQLPPLSINHTPGFMMAPQMQRQTTTVNPTTEAVTASLAALSVSMSTSGSHQLPPSPPPPSSLPSLTAPLPQLAQLQAAAQQIQSPAHDVALKVAWCRDVLFLVDRHVWLALAHTSQTPSSSATGPPTDPLIGPVNITDPALEVLAHIAVPLILHIASSSSHHHHPGTPKIPAHSKPPPHIAEALYHKAMLASTGAFPTYIPHNPRSAFRDFEASARAGHSASWFRLGRDYENFGDTQHARECFERGAKGDSATCVYRMGMAWLLGQLGCPQDPSRALGLLYRAARLANLAGPQPAYVFGLLLLSSFLSPSLPPLPMSAFAPYVPVHSSPTLEARVHLERAAYLHFPAAQYKLGHAYEYGEKPWGWDPVMSVRWYSLASEGGEAEADMALSKWFLCGSGGAAMALDSGNATGGSGGFEKDEGLALLFAAKAARKGLPSAEFAMGYYAEVGVGQQRDVREARRWYELASAHGNPDAPPRLLALSASTPSPLTRADHDTLTEAKLIRRRTMAREKAEKEREEPVSPPWQGREFSSMREWEEAGTEVGVEAGQPGQGQGQRKRADGRMVVDVIRKNSMAYGYVNNPPASAPVGGVMQSIPVGSRVPSGGAPGPGMGQPIRRGQSPRRSQSRERERARYEHDGPAPLSASASLQSAVLASSNPNPTSHPHANRGSHPNSRTASPARYGRITPPVPIGGRPPSPGRHLPPTPGIGGGGRGGQEQGQGGQGRRESPARGRQGQPSLDGGPDGQSPSQSQVQVQQGQARGKLERMRLNLDDPGYSFSPSASSSSLGNHPHTQHHPHTHAHPSRTGSTPNPNGYGFTLTDGGPTPTPTTATVNTPATATPHAGVHTPRPGYGRQPSGPAPGPGTPGGGAKTFAEMGFQGVKAEEKDCVIM